MRILGKWALTSTLILKKMKKVN